MPLRASKLAVQERYNQKMRLAFLAIPYKGEEDPDPAKAEQYVRWRELRKLQDAQAGGQKGN